MPQIMAPERHISLLRDDGEAVGEGGIACPVIMSKNIRGCGAERVNNFETLGFGI